jgi:hypothetical protein
MTTGCVTLWRKALALRILIGAGVALSAQGSQPSAETILINGHVITVDQQFSIAQAVAIANGKFVAVGTNPKSGDSLDPPPKSSICTVKRRFRPRRRSSSRRWRRSGVDLSRASIADVLAAVAASVKQAARTT